jgi:hypothetical protein
MQMWGLSVGGENNFEHRQHRPKRSLVCRHHRLVEFALPCADRCQGREIAAGHDKGFDLRLVDAGKGVARVPRAEIADRIRIGGVEAFSGDGFKRNSGRRGR